MNDNGSNSKLDWMYKGANSLVDREEYLLGRSVDKSLEQLNSEEKEKRLGLVPPKNHVEHECIPPSIRDFNKIVQAEQVDISAKLQEDPLVAIKKREEEARRQFLQNPVQLKKLQEALKAQELKKKKAKHKKSKGDSDSDIDSKIAKKLKYLKADPSSVSMLKKKKKKSKDDALDTILMHKFNELKDQLSQEDLNDILAGKVSDSDEETEKEDEYKRRRNTNSEENRNKQRKLIKEKRNWRRSESENLSKKTRRKRKNSSSSSDRSSEDEGCYKRNRKKRISDESYDRDETRKKLDDKASYKNKRSRSLERKKTHRSSSESISEESREGRGRQYDKKTSDTRKTKDEHCRDKEPVKAQKKSDPDLDLESKILEKLRMLRDSAKSKRSDSSSESEHGGRIRGVPKHSAKRKDTKNSTSTSDSSDSEESRSQKHRYDSDSDEKVPQIKAFGLVKADGSKISLNKNLQEVKKIDKQSKVETVTKPDRKNVKRLTEEEKEKMRREMMMDAEKREKERSENLKRYREEDKREDKNSANFDKDFLRKQLLKTTKEATVESRIKSNLNNIQRSSRHMDTHFSRR